MITLYSFGRNIGLPDPSPFVSKVEILLKMAGLPYQTDTSGFNKAPKGKLPYINDAGTIVADSSLIRTYLEQRHEIDFDKGVPDERKAIAWAAEKMCEDHLYWAIVDNRWMVDANFNKGPRSFFDQAPAPVRPFIIAMVRRSVGKTLKAQGLGRHARSEIERFAARDIDALGSILGSKAWFGGDTPCGSDASLWSFITGALCPHFDGGIRPAAERHPNLAAYSQRGFERWYPELKSAGA